MNDNQITKYEIDSLERNIRNQIEALGRKVDSKESTNSFYLFLILFYLVLIFLAALNQTKN